MDAVKVGGVVGSVLWAIRETVRVFKSKMLESKETGGVTIFNGEYKKLMDTLTAIQEDANNERRWVRAKFSAQQIENESFQKQLKSLAERA